MKPWNVFRSACGDRSHRSLALLACCLALPVMRVTALQTKPAARQESEDDIAAGSSALARGENEMAESAFRKALSRNPESVLLLNNLALSLARQNRNTEAIELYRRVLAHKPGDAITELNLGAAYFRARRYVEARPLLERSAATSQNANLVKLAGLDLFALDRYAEAAAYLERAHDMNPGDLETLDLLGQAYLRMKNFTGMTEVFKRILETSPDSAPAHVLLATAEDKLFREQEAIHEFQQAERIDPSYPGVHTGLGVIYFRMDEPELAKQEFLLALRQSATDPVANCTLGRILRQEAKLQEAILYFDAALAVNADYIDALREAGQSWLALQQPARAIVFLKRAVAVEPTDPQLHFVLGTALRASGQETEGNLERAAAARILAQQHAAGTPDDKHRSSATK